MTAKAKDKNNRWRSKTVAFRMSPEEAKQLDDYAKLSGLSKQGYLINRVLGTEIVVVGNSRTYKMLRDTLAEVLIELKRIKKRNIDDDELIDLIKYISTIINGFKGEQDGIK